MNSMVIYRLCKVVEWCRGYVEVRTLRTFGHYVFLFPFHLAHCLWYLLDRWCVLSVFYVFCECLWYSQETSVGASYS